MKRREAIQRIMIGTGTILLPASILSSCSEEPEVIAPGGGSGGNGDNGNLEIDLDDAANGSLNEDGAYKIVSGIIVINTGGGNFIALSSTCTHQGCSVEYDSSAGNVPCNCHGSLFSTTGSVLRGPAARPLQQYEVKRTENLLEIITT